MRKIVLQIFTSLDGFIEDGEHSLGWMYEDADVEAYLNEVLRSIDGMIFGRKAHEALAAYWPTAADSPQATPAHLEAAELMQTLPKYVVTHGGYETNWANSHAIGGDVAGEIERLKAEPGKDIALFAGAGVARSFIRLGLVDEYRIVVNSVLIGDGTPLFEPGGPRIELELFDTRRFGSGAVILFYRPKA